MILSKIYTFEEKKIIGGVICPCQKMARISSIVTGFLHCALVCNVLMGKTIYQTKENVLLCVNMLVKVLSKSIIKE